VYYLLFFLSGFPALLYQLVWQRSLFTLYGVNVQSVTMIVTIFMLGLGLGSFAGGWLSSRRWARPRLAFGLIELCIGAFGAASLWIFHRVALFTAGASTAKTGLIAFALLLLPTLLMGSTLPLLVEHVARRTANVGQTIGSLYSVNTLGSGVACLAAAMFLMRALGEAGTVRLAVCFNMLVGVTAVLLRSGPDAKADRMESLKSGMTQETIPFWIGLLLAGASGFIALAYEIVWYRLYSFVSGSRAECFAKLLAFYLFGIAYGSILVRDACRKRLGNDVRLTLRICSQVVVIGTAAAFLLGPALARAVVGVPYDLTFTFVFIAAGLLGSAFPLLAHASIVPGNAVGKRTGFLYLSNIVGSTLGSFLVGFVVLDHFSTRVTSLLLMAMGLVVAGALAILSGPKGLRNGVFAGGCAACVIAGATSGPLFANMYERMLYKPYYRSGMKFSDVVENRNGVIAVSHDGVVYGGGVYDGRFNTDLIDDTNGLFRVYAMDGLHPNPKDVLVIGLSSGSWAQVAANDANVQDETIVEINPGYLPLIRKHAEVTSLLKNPKVHIVIDDGRRWLVGHPERKFDFILMNTTYNWRANASNLLSMEFLKLIRAHLNPEGVAYYNTTWSNRALETGALEFPYAVRIANFIAVSDSPVGLDANLWSARLLADRIDGHPVFDVSDPMQRERLNEVLAFSHEGGFPSEPPESRAGLLQRLKGVRIITDDNMGNEWGGSE
jgi:spermidine synthase